ncbi:MAG: ATP synthase F1 subunit delta [Candidatus Izemoplasma sp.]
MNYIAYQYAEALFGLALESNQVNNVLEDFNQFNSALDLEITKFLNHPKISKKNKKEVISNAINGGIFKRFLYVLIDNSRIDIIEDVLKEFDIIINKQNNLLKVIAYSKKELSSSQFNQLKVNLEKKNNRKIELESIVDKTIVGGVRIEYEGMIFDDTINNYLSGLKANLTK